MSTIQNLQSFGKSGSPHRPSRDPTSPARLSAGRPPLPALAGAACRTPTPKGPRPPSLHPEWGFVSVPGRWRPGPWRPPLRGWPPEPRPRALCRPLPAPGPSCCSLLLPATSATLFRPQTCPADRQGDAGSGWGIGVH